MFLLPEEILLPPAASRLVRLRFPPVDPLMKGRRLARDLTRDERDALSRSAAAKMLGLFAIASSTSLTNLGSLRSCTQPRLIFLELPSLEDFHAAGTSILASLEGAPIGWQDTIPHRTSAEANIF